MSKSLWRTAVIATLLLGGASIAIAQVKGTAAEETGLAQALHDLRNEGGRLCMSDHFHYGSSNGQPNRTAAEAEAIKSWASFTDLEYGNVWADFRIAASRGMKCGQSGNSWSCDVEARPCKRGGSVAFRKKR